jgi:hypothetical protein
MLPEQVNVLVIATQNRRVARVHKPVTGSVLLQGTATRRCNQVHDLGQERFAKEYELRLNAGPTRCRRRPLQTQPKGYEGSSKAASLPMTRKD